MTRVLFVCVKNGGKSQMAAGLFGQLLTDDPIAGVTASSAGTKAGTALNELSVEVLAESGVDISDQRPRQLTSQLQEESDIVVTLGTVTSEAEAQLESVSGPRYLTWETDEPSGRGIEGAARMRLIRDDIARRVGELHDSLKA